MDKNFDQNEKSNSPSTELLYGRHPVVDALENNRTIEKVLLSNAIHGEFEKRLRYLCKEANVPMQVVPKERLNSITRKNHQGVIAFVSPIPYYHIEDILPMVYDKGETPLFILVDGVTDVRNIGAIARSAEAAGAHALVLPKKGSAQINDEAMKSSAGALSSLPVCRVNSLMTTVEFLQLNGVQVIAADLKGDKMLYDLELNGPLAIVMGDEAKGVNRMLLEKVDQPFKIPMRGQTDSFNVSVATGIILYEVLRQQMGSNS
jgi:23S rRNA (guanosine2251-2'-O)-methyltransferase